MHNREFREGGTHPGGYQKSRGTCKRPRPSQENTSGDFCIGGGSNKGYSWPKITPSMRDEAIYLLRLFAVVIVVGMVLCQMLNFAIYGLGGRG